MFILQASTSDLKVLQREAITSNTDYVYNVLFKFSSEWDGLEKRSIFKAAGVCKTSQMYGDQCEIPSEVLRAGGSNLICGIMGLRDDQTVIPAVWTSLNKLPLNSSSGSGIPSSAVKPSGSGGSADDPSQNPDIPGVEVVTDHSKLNNRNAADSHPISAITGLKDRLEKLEGEASKAFKAVPITKEQLKQILDS